MRAYSQANGHTRDRRPRAVLVIAHPGHELRVHGWLEAARPEVWILTDGSGRTQQSRIDSTTRVLEATGGAPGPIYGNMSDAELYNAVLSFDYRRFTEIVDQLAAALIRDEIDYVAGDAEEGYNPAHDICRYVINAAIRLVKRKTKKEIANYDFSLIAAPGQCPDELRTQSIWLNLDVSAFARKLSAARNYPELQAEVESALNGANETLRHHSDLAERVRSTFGVTDVNNFRVECLRPVNADILSPASFNGDAPFYEAYGERKVSAGVYSNVLRFTEHMMPLAAALDVHVESNS